MRKRVMRTTIDIGSVDLPENYRKIVLQQNKSRITIRNTSVNADSSIENKQKLLLNRLDEFFNEREHFEQLVHLLEQTSSISLRLLDWVVTNYSKKNCVYLKVERNGVVETVNLFLDYSNFRLYSRKNLNYKYEHQQELKQRYKKIFPAIQ